ncbi:MAG: NAD-dependent epimerase [Acidobacteriota bacterium]
MKILITGTAGFIGYHLVQNLTEKNIEIIGIDNINDYYDVNLKYARLNETGIDKSRIDYNVPVKSSKYPNYTFIKLDLEDRENISNLFKDNSFQKVCHLAAQAGVRYSLENPYAYINSNINGFLNILEGVRHTKVGHLVYASSSSVYGLNKKMPFSTSHNIDHPVSLYAATKKSNELMAHSYSYLYNIPVTGLRFFTVYGPWGRPDMALFKFVKSITEGNSIDVYNYGKMKRDFTYIDDIIKGIIKVLERSPEGNKGWSGEQPDPSTSIAPFKVYNIGNGNPVNLMDFISTTENILGKKAEKNLLPIQPGDVEATWADTGDLERDHKYKPGTDIEYGVKKFIDWYKLFYNI